MSGEAGLWAAVIGQALMDATSFQIAAEAPASAARLRAAARRWLTQPNADFSAACIAAGVDEASVRALAVKEIEAFERMAASGVTRRRSGKRTYNTVCEA